MRPLLLTLIFVLGFGCGARAQDRLTRGDLNFFFERVSFHNGQWEFKLSPNVRGMLWRIRKDRSDLTGACESGQVLNVPALASLEIKRKDIRLYFAPRDVVSFNVYLTLDPEKSENSGREDREVIIVAWQGDMALRYAGD
jgi:hypothetical protein